MEIALDIIGQYLWNFSGVFHAIPKNDPGRPGSAQATPTFPYWYLVDQHLPASEFGYWQDGVW